MRRELFQPSADGEARLLLLIDAFTGPSKSLEGRTKLAKLDFFLRHPAYLSRLLGSDAEGAYQDIESRMIRYRYGPWDPAYFALLGALLGRGLIELVALPRGLGYRTTTSGHQLADGLANHEAWHAVAARARLLRERLDLSGNTLKRLVYENFPEVTGAQWGEPL